MNIFTQTVLVIGRITPEAVLILGTGYIVSNDGKIVTARHVVGNDDKGLCVLAPHINNINNYQDTTDTSCRPVNASIIEADPIKDIAILKADFTFSGNLPKISGFDGCNVGDKLGIFGYPHATDGRRVLTFQSTELGAKVLLESQGIKSKYGILNTQARPGQSGSLVISMKSNEIVGLLIGAYSALSSGSVIIAGINPKELHQTTHCISSEYIKDMI